eukprot:2628997-Prymnesium_polylepis.1
MRADPPLFNIRFGKTVREAPASPVVKASSRPAGQFSSDDAVAPIPLSPAAPARPLRHVVAF